MFPDQYSPKNFQTIIDRPDEEKPKRFFEEKEAPTGLYIKDPIGFFFYKQDPSGIDAKAYRENVAVSAFLYTEKVKPHFVEAAAKLGRDGYGVDWLMRVAEAGEVIELGKQEFAKQVKLQKRTHQQRNNIDILQRIKKKKEK